MVQFPKQSEIASIRVSIATKIAPGFCCARNTLTSQCNAAPGTIIALQRKQCVATVPSLEIESYQYVFGTYDRLIHNFRENAVRERLRLRSNSKGLAQPRRTITLRRLTQPAQLSKSNRRRSLR